MEKRVFLFGYMPGGEGYAPSVFPELVERTGQVVDVLQTLTEDEADSDNGPMFKILFADGLEHTAFAHELEPLQVTQPSAAAIAEATRTQAYFPYRRVWVVMNEDGTHEILAPIRCTAHLANKKARSGKSVFEVTR